ncbi:fibrillin-1-like [Sycon ciliatum]|uniref:fibrillin-1-like n=1 Tax=Sycon ciliatum TaxID=27933 RepID=UPI0031F6357C
MNAPAAVVAEDTNCMTEWLLIANSSRPRALSILSTSAAIQAMLDEAVVKQLRPFTLSIVLGFAPRLAADLKHCISRTPSCPTTDLTSHLPCSVAGECVFNATQQSSVCLCQPGMTGRKCDVDIDECNIPGLNNCDKPGVAKCHNSYGSFACECNTGFGGHSGVCEDINECANSTYTCHGLDNPGNRKCVNTEGSYYCRCLDGFTGSTCIDIDECQNGKHNCNEMVNSDNRQCQNLNGSYHCPCLPGYVGSQCDAQLKRKYTKAAHMSVQTAALQNTVGAPGSNALSLTCNEAYETTSSAARQDPSLYDTIQ